MELLVGTSFLIAGQGITDSTHPPFPRSINASDFWKWGEGRGGFMRNFSFYKKDE